MKTRNYCGDTDTLVIECRACGDPTEMVGTKLCDRCWELERRIERDFDIALRIIDHIQGKRNQ